MMVKNTNQKVSCCFLADTWIRMADGSEKQITEVKIGDRIFTLGGQIQEVGCDTKQMVESYYLLRTESGHEIKITGNHPILTKDGWKIVKELSLGDSVMYMPRGKITGVFEGVTAHHKIIENVPVFNLICEEKPLIANGFVCSDFHMQYKMELIAQIKRQKNFE